MSSEYNLSTFGEGDSRGNIYCAINMSNLSNVDLYIDYISQEGHRVVAIVPPHPIQEKELPALWSE